MNMQICLNYFLRMKVIHTRESQLSHISVQLHKTLYIKLFQLVELLVHFLVFAPFPQNSSRLFRALSKTSDAKEELDATDLAEVDKTSSSSAAAPVEEVESKLNQ